MKQRTRIIVGPWVHSKYGLLTKQRGILCAAGVLRGGGAGGTLALTTLVSNVVQFGGPATAGVRTLATGNVEELGFTGWTAQNPSTEWIDDFGGASAGDYEVQLTSGSVTGPVTMSGPLRGQYWAMSSTRQWTITNTGQGQGTYSGAMLIREIANTANNVTAGVVLTATWDIF